MLFVAILLTLLATLLLAMVRRIKLAAVCAGLVLTLALGSPLIAGVLLRALQSGYEEAVVPERWGARVALVVLGMGSSQLPDGAVEAMPMSAGRIARAADAYRECVASGARCTVIASGGDPQGSGQSEADVMAEYLERLGVAAADIEREDRSLNTWQNAEQARPLVAALQADQVALITSGVHMRRAMLFFQRHGMEPIPIRSDYAAPIASFPPMAYNIALADVAIAEYMGIAQYRLYEAMGWNETK